MSRGIKMATPPGLEPGRPSLEGQCSMILPKTGRYWEGHLRSKELP